MKKFIPLVSLLTFSAFVLVTQPTQAHSIELSPEELAESPQLSLSSLPLPTFVGDEEAVVTETVMGDLYIGGGTVAIKADVLGDVLVAGGTVTIQGNVEQDVRVAGGTVIIVGHVGGSVTALGGEVSFLQDSTVDGSVIVAGGDVNLDGNIGGHVFAGAGTLGIDGVVLGHVKGGSGDLSVGPNARISGDLAVNVQGTFSVNENAVIEGRRDIRIVEDNHKNKVDKQSNNWAQRGWMLTWGMLSALLGGGLLLRMFPKQTKRVANSIVENPLPTIGWGLIFMFLTPIVIVLLMITVIGLPLGVLALLGYIATYVVSSWIVSLAVGQKIAEVTKSKHLKPDIIQLGAGIFVLAVLKTIPVIGWMVGLIVMLAGLGAIWKSRTLLFHSKNS